MKRILSKNEMDAPADTFNVEMDELDFTLNGKSWDAVSIELTILVVVVTISIC